MIERCLTYMVKAVFCKIFSTMPNHSSISLEGNVIFFFHVAKAIEDQRALDNHRAGERKPPLG